MKKFKILIVDDDLNFRQLIKCVLETDFSVFVAEDGEHGNKLAKGCNPDLMLVDINMPGMSGIDFVKKMARDPKTKKIPIIVLTGGDQYNAATNAEFKKEESVKAFMSKLSPVEDITEQVAKVFKDKSL